MSIDAIDSVDEVNNVSSESDETLRNNYNNSVSAVLSGYLQKIGNGLSKSFWLSQQQFFSGFSPIHPGKYGQSEFTVVEIFKRTIRMVISYSLVLSSYSFFLLGRSLIGIGNVLKNYPYRYVSGDYKGNIGPKDKIFNMNACMLPGTQPLNEGITPATNRFDTLVKTIRENDPDLLFLSQHNAMLGMPMVNALKDRYKHFFIDIGLNVREREPSFFLAYRGEVVKPPAFIPFNEKIKGINSGFFSIETPKTIYISTHIHNQIAEQKQDQLKNGQLQQILTYIEEEKKRIVLMGDLGFDRDTDQYKLLIENGFFDYGIEQDTTTTNIQKVHMQKLDIPTIHQTTDYMLIKEKDNSNVDYNMTVLPSYVVGNGFDSALSNHHAIITHL